MKWIAAFAGMVLVPALGFAQSPPASKPKAPVKKQAGSDAVPSKAPPSKTKVAKAAATSSRTQLKSAANQMAVAESALTPGELAIAERVQLGRMPCELGAFVTVTADAQTPGRFYVEGKGFKYTMSPIVTSTGTVRLEDRKAGAVWLQIANKSMLMNQRVGQRLADECMSPQQMVVAEAIKKNPPRSVLEPLPATKP